MKRSGSKRRPATCPVTFALGVFGDRWTLVVLRGILLDGHQRYKALLAANPGLATNVLADRLKRLEAHGLVNKRRDADDARQFVYSPTESAITAIPMLVEMIAWAASQGQGAVSKEFLERFERDRKGLIEALQSKARAIV